MNKFKTEYIAQCIVCSDDITENIEVFEDLENKNITRILIHPCNKCLDRAHDEAFFE